MEEFPVLLSYPVAWGICKLKISQKFSNNLITKIVIILSVIATFIIIFPISFEGWIVDFVIFQTLVILIFILGLRLKNDEKKFGIAIVIFGQLSMILFPIFYS